MTLRWDDAEDIAERLIAAHPDVDPLTIRFTDLHRWVCALPEFAEFAENAEIKSIQIFSAPSAPSAFNFSSSRAA